MMRAVLIAGLVGFAVTGLSTAEASIISYSETVSGDLVFNSVTPPFLGTLDVGANTVSGRIGFDSSSTDFDSFAFSVAVGQRLDSVTFAITRASGAMNSAGWSLANGSTTLASLSASVPSTTSVFATALPLSSGNYKIAGTFLGGVGFSDYTFTLNVSALDAAPTPEPTSIALLGMGAIGFARFVRQRRTV